jgi:cysteine desulfurase/selenocysteine lyase
MPPWQFGSNMAHDVGIDGHTLSPGALKFGAGTPNVAGAVGLAAAIRFLCDIGLDATWQHEQALTRDVLGRLSGLRAVRVLGSAPLAQRIAVFSFVVDGVPVPEVVAKLDEIGIGVRGGDLAARPLLERLGVSRAARASFYLYSSQGEAERLAQGLQRLSH